MINLEGNCHKFENKKQKLECPLEEVRLPPEILVMIFSHLDSFSEKMNASLVNRSWKSAIMNDKIKFLQNKRTELNNQKEKQDLKLKIFNTSSSEIKTLNLNKQNRWRAMRDEMERDLANNLFTTIKTLGTLNWILGVLEAENS